MRVLVTGGCGFIGSHLVDRLNALGASVLALDNLQSGRWTNLDGAPSVLRVDADVREHDEVRRVVNDFKPGVVFHLAANASVPASVLDPCYDFETNALGTFNVLDAIRGDPSCRLVLASSGAVYGEPTTFPLSETSPMLPISPYGASKVGAETLCRTFADVYKTPTTIARIFNAYGPRMARFVILDFLRKLRRNSEDLEILGTGNQVRDFTFVDDTVDGMLLLAVRGRSGEAYNLSSGYHLSVTHLAEMLIAEKGLSVRTRLHFTGSSWAGDAQRWEVSLEKIRAIGYEPRVALKEGLRRTIAWFDATEGALAGEET